MRSGNESETKASEKALSNTYDTLTDHSYGLEMAIAPKAMADMVEALAGAIYIDSSGDLKPVFEVNASWLCRLPWNALTRLITRLFALCTKEKMIGEQRAPSRHSNFGLEGGFSRGLKRIAHDSDMAKSQH